MKAVIDPGKHRKPLTFFENIPYSTVKDNTGKEMTLTLSIMMPGGNSEMRLTTGVDDELTKDRYPVIVWFNGYGWRGINTLSMTGEMQYFADRGYAVAFVYYRGTGEGQWPAQIIDCKTAVRFLRAHAEKYKLDPDHIAAAGRSAGGHLAAWMAMNGKDFETEEWVEYSSDVQCACDMFGPVCIRAMNELELEKMKKPGSRWKDLRDSFSGKLLGGDSVEEILARSDSADPTLHITENTAPLLILHGDQDPQVPTEVSDVFYERLVAAGFENQTDYYVVKNGGHGTREFFQEETKQLILRFFDKYLR